MHRVTRRQVKWTPEMEAELLRLRTNGTHPRDVADHFGVSVATVDARFYKLKKARQ